MSLPAPIPLSEAWDRLRGGAEPLGPEQVRTADALGRYLAQDLSASRTQPAADLSAMDGYAVPLGDDGGPWIVVGESAAGHPFSGELAPGQAVRISTGAIIPAGAGMVLLQENARRDGNGLSLNGQGTPSPSHIRRAGFDFRSGETLLDAGTRLGPAQLALAISGGHAELPVGRRPLVAVLDSGDELAADPTGCPQHQIPASNGAMLAAMAAPFAASVKRIGPVPDRHDALAAALGQAEDVDVLVTSGGASVGDHDLIRPAIEQWGGSVDFWRVALKPGKPLMLARRGPQWILGLPGNPVSSYVTAFLFLLPLLRRLAGAGSAAVLPRVRNGVLAAALPATGDRQEFIRAALDERHRLVPLDQQDSSALRALARAEALIDRPARSALAAPGETVRYYSLENGGIA